tara:strand:- start:823 stop:1023 length:201 start_codon:yes stop_codon:yes gene_type:complete
MLDRNKIIEYMIEDLENNGWRLLKPKDRLQMYIESNSDIRIPSSKERQMSIISWVQKNLNWIAPKK